jgi:DNA-binding NarL/FixJ family response regulator
MIRALSVDDHVIVRNGFKHLFHTIGGIVMAGEAANGEQALELLRHQSFDLVLQDLAMPGLCGIELVGCIREVAPDTPILIYSMCEELHIARQAFMAGANGYAAKSSPQDVLIEAMKKVAAGGRFIDPIMAEKLAFDGGLATNVRLSKRELQVLKLLGQGMSVTEIAEANSIHSKTVSTYKQRLMTKMKFKNNTDLMRYAIERSSDA